VLEEMEYATPLLLTDGWTLPVTITARFGWRVSGEDSAFESALLEAMNTLEDRLKEMGHNARFIVREHFGWDGVAKQACSLYASLLGGSHESKG
jgi:glycosyltransferase involved in cell wall biosynthesis